MKTPKQLIDNIALELTMFDGGFGVLDKRSREWEVYFFKDRCKTLAGYYSIGGYDAHRNLKRNPFISDKERTILVNILVWQGPLLLQN